MFLPYEIWLAILLNNPKSNYEEIEDYDDDDEDYDDDRIGD